ncbi:hypothetical protein [Actinosynnema sp. NPDC020468]|uniref:hypothetical protein n=1 Tax=Actinosynnema sp. NPDC020468 TaxID=3154488 RepID=UPI0033E10669
MAPTTHDVPARPVLTFAAGHRCDRYRVVEGFYECCHGNVRRVRDLRPRGVPSGR